MVTAQQHRSRAGRQVDDKSADARNQSRARKEAVTVGCSEKLTTREKSLRESSAPSPPRGEGWGEGCNRKVEIGTQSHNSSW